MGGGGWDKFNPMTYLIYINKIPSSLRGAIIEHNVSFLVWFGPKNLDIHFFSSKWTKLTRFFVFLQFFLSRIIYRKIYRIIHVSIINSRRFTLYLWDIFKLLPFKKCSNKYGKPHTMHQLDNGMLWSFVNNFMLGRFLFKFFTSF